MMTKIAILRMTDEIKILAKSWSKSNEILMPYLLSKIFPSRFSRSMIHHWFNTTKFSFIHLFGHIYFYFLFHFYTHGTYLMDSMFFYFVFILYSPFISIHFQFQIILLYLYWMILFLEHIYDSIKNRFCVWLVH